MVAKFIASRPNHGEGSGPFGASHRRRRHRGLRAIAQRASSRPPAGIQTVLDEMGKEAKGKNWKFGDFDLCALRELEKEGFFK